jgi:hypothetical protein
MKPELGRAALRSSSQWLEQREEPEQQRGRFRRFAQYFRHDRSKNAHQTLLFSSIFQPNK